MIYKNIDYTYLNKKTVSFGGSINVQINSNLNRRLSTFIKASYYIDPKYIIIQSSDISLKYKENGLGVSFGIRTTF